MACDVWEEAEGIWFIQRKLRGDHIAVDNYLMGEYNYLDLDSSQGGKQKHLIHLIYQVTIYCTVNT